MVTNDDVRQAFSAKLNALLDYVGFPKKGDGRQKALANDFGVSQKGARKWLEAESLPTTARLGKIVKKYEKTGVTTDWFLSGDLNNPPWEGTPKKELEYPQSDYPTGKHKITDIEKAEYLRVVLSDALVDLIIPMEKLTEEQIHELRERIIDDVRKNDQVIEKYIKNHIKQG